MTPVAGAPPVLPRWLGALWVWLPAVAALALFGGAAVLQVGSGDRVGWWAAAAIGCAVAYAGRERWPVAALVVTVGVVAAGRLPGVDVLSSGFDVVYLVLLFVPVLPLMAVAGRLPARRSLLALVGTAAVTIAVSPVPAWSGPDSTRQATVAGYVLTVGVPVMIALGAWLAGYAIRTRRQYAEASAEREASLALRRDAESARVIAEERTLIAREVHDVVTHSVAVMVVQAAAAGAVWDRDPAQARASLEAVEESGRTVMADLRGLLDTMRAGDMGGAPLRAQPGLDQLHGLVSQIQTTGVLARMSLAGKVERVAPLTSLSLLRIAQESVTNALRHGRPTAIAINVEVGEDTVRLSVRDDGVGIGEGKPEPQGGHGVAGMRERADLIGGTLGVSPGVAGGTVVTVLAPLRQESLA